MKRCPITYENISEQENYSPHGLRLLAPQLKNLNILELSAEEQRETALQQVGKISIQGVQPKLSARLKIKEGRFEIVDHHGQFILKPQSLNFPQMPENEAISLSLAERIGIEVPVHGLIYSKDGSKTYFIKRFDRTGHNKKIAVEDFAQLLGVDRDTKYESSMEKVVRVIETYCTFPKIEFINLLKLTLFNFLIGNEDMHLKNFSLITHGKKVTLSPAYDLLNSTIEMKNPHEEIALPLNGKKNNLKANDFFKYFAKDRLELNKIIIDEVIQQIKTAIPEWKKMISNSFLSKDMQEKYLNLLGERCERLGL